MRRLSTSVLTVLLLALILASSRLVGALWVQNRTLEGVTTIAQSHLSGSSRMAEALSHISDVEKYKRYSASALSGSNNLLRGSSDLVRIVQSNTRQLLIYLAAINAALFVLVLAVYAKLRSATRANS